MEYVASSFGYSNILHTLYYIIDLWSVHVSVCLCVRLRRPGILCMPFIRMRWMAPSRNPEKFRLNDIDILTNGWVVV